LAAAVLVLVEAVEDEDDSVTLVPFAFPSPSAFWAFFRSALA
jgi:hypothetical protein